MSALYLYACVAGDGPADNLLGAFGEALRLVEAAQLRFAAGALHGLASATREHLAAHDDTVRRLAERFSAVLPLRFGQVVPDESALARELSPVQLEVERALALVEGCEQMTLQVRFEASPHDDEPAPAGGPGARWLRRRAQLHTLPALAPVRAALGELLRAERVRWLPGAKDLARVCHLIPRGGAERYRAALERAAPVVPGATLRVSGPWPTYAFAPECLA